MILSSTWRKLALSIHLTCSVGWIGAVLAYLGLGITAVAATEPGTVRGAWTGMELIGWYVLVPLAVSSVLTGVVLAVGSRWGLLRHYWVVFALVLTTLATAVLIMHMPSVSETATTVQSAPAAQLDRYGGDLFHASLALAMLVGIELLNVFKPPGITPYGWRKQQEQRARQVAGTSTHAP